MMQGDTTAEPTPDALPRSPDTANPASPETTEAAPTQSPRGYQWLGMLPFALVHLAVFGAIWTGVTWAAVICCFGLLFFRMFAITAGYHRYFAHRTFKTSRPMQFLFAFFAQTSAQKGALWWAGHHRVHHKYSDQPEDMHSPVQRGFWYSHVMWIFDHTDWTRWERMQDFARYPELRFLDRFYLLPPILMGAAVYWWLGLSGLIIGFFLSTVLLWHSTFFINSLAHVIGKRRFDTKDESRNSVFLALLTFGEGWHNNHHRYQSSTRQGFYWWEIDITYAILKMMSWVGLVWDLREPPARVLEEGRENDRARRAGGRNPATQAPAIDADAPAAEAPAPAEAA